MFFTRPAIETWYAHLRKPVFTPPNRLFGPVWITLYLLMGIALYLVWRRDGGEPHGRAAVAVFIVQLVLNAAWSPAFFGLRSPLAGLLVIVLLLAAVVLTIQRFAVVSGAAAILLVPYALWVGFAAVLNAALFFLNR
jgi:benzodiazapine receptor